MNERFPRTARRGLLGGLGLLAMATILLVPGAALAGDRPLVGAAELEELLARDDAPLLLDVRTPGEFAGGHVPGALLIPVAELTGRLDQIAAFKERGVIAYCERGGRAERALDILEAAGFSNLTLLDGHMQAYRQRAPQ